MSELPPSKSTPSLTELPDEHTADEHPAVTDPPAAASWWMAILCLILWGILLVVTNSVFVFGYAVVTGGPQLVETLSQDPAALQSLLESMSVEFMSFMLVAQNAVVWAITLAAVWVVARVTLKGSSGSIWRDPTIPRSLGIRPPRGSLPWLLVAPIIGCLTYGIAQGVRYVVSMEESAELLDRLATEPIGFLGLFVLAVVMAPITEELFFRGFLYPSLRQPLVRSVPNRRAAIVTAVVTSSLVFSLVHVGTYGGFKLGFLAALFVMSLVMTALREISGSIWPAVWAHAAFNALSLLLVGLDQWLHFTKAGAL